MRKPHNHTLGLTLVNKGAAKGGGAFETLRRVTRTRCGVTLRVGEASKTFLYTTVALNLPPLCKHSVDEVRIHNPCSANACLIRDLAARALGLRIVIYLVYTCTDDLPSVCYRSR